jgi:hypothetical protein
MIGKFPPPLYGFLHLGIHSVSIRALLPYYDEFTKLDHGWEVHLLGNCT